MRRACLAVAAALLVSAPAGAETLRFNQITPSSHFFHSALLVPWSSVLTTYTGSWHAVFVTAAIMNAIAAIMALAVLRPLRAARQSDLVAETATSEPRPVH